MHLFGGRELQRSVWPPGVIHADPVRGRLPRLTPVFKIGIQPIFLFQDPVDSLGQSILRAMVLLSHAHGQTGPPHGAHVGVGGILASPIRMMDWPLRPFEPFHRHGQGFEHLLGFQRFPKW